MSYWKFSNTSLQSIQDKQGKGAPKCRDGRDSRFIPTIFEIGSDEMVCQSKGKMFFGKPIFGKKLFGKILNFSNKSTKFKQA